MTGVQTCALPIWIDKALSKTTKEELKQEILGRIKITANLYESEHADLMIEALTEDMELKKEVFRELDNECSVDTIFATNTSSLSLTELSQPCAPYFQYVLEYPLCNLL